MTDCRITQEYARRGIPLVVMENDRLRIELLAGKGGDITEIRDKTTDTNLLFESPHEWRAPDETGGLRPDEVFSFMDHYPGGWQDVLPGAGQPSTVAGAPLGQHGESTVLPYDVAVERTAEGVAATLTLTLSRYPLSIDRTVALERGSATVEVTEEVTNEGEVAIDYSWLQHIVFGPPFIGPAARLEIPCQRILVDQGHDDPNARFEPGAEFTWPYCETEAGDRVDLRRIPPKSARVHDLVALADFDEGRYTIRNSDLGLAVTVEFPVGLFEYVWYWQPFGGFEAAPYFGRAYAAGLEPATSIPNAGLEEAIANGTANTLRPGTTETMSMSVAVSASDTERD